MSSHSFDIVKCNGGAVGLTKNPAVFAALDGIVQSGRRVSDTSGEE